MVFGKWISKEGQIDAIILLPGFGEHMQAGASKVVIKASAEMTDGSFSMSETTLPAGMKGPPHGEHKFFERFKICNISN